MKYDLNSSNFVYETCNKYVIPRIYLYYRKYKKLDIKTLQQIILSKIEESKINIDELNFKTKFKIYLFKSQKYMLIYIYYAQKRIIKKILAMIFNNKLG